MGKSRINNDPKIESRPGIESGPGIEHDARMVSDPASSLAPRRWLVLALSQLSAVELFLLLFALFLGVVALVGSRSVTLWPEVLFRMTTLSGLIIAMNIWASFNTHRRWMRPLKIFYVAPLIPVYFKTTELISYPLHGHDFDPMLIRIDRLLTGTDPTVWLYHHLIASPVSIVMGSSMMRVPSPWLTEYLQICYALFYFLPIILSAELYRRMREREEEGHVRPIESRQLEQTLFVVVSAFLFSYGAYFLFPSVGPRFTLHDFLSSNSELPGLALTRFLRPILDGGENVQSWMTSAQARAVVTRDAFPSGHTDVTFLTMILAFKFKARTRWVLLVLGTSLIFSTLYLRYHYLIDLLGGMTLGLLTLAVWRPLRDTLVDWRDRALVRIS